MPFLARDSKGLVALAERVKALATGTMAHTQADDVLLSRAAMAFEELAEWITAHAESDLVAAADGWADRAYVLFGDAVAAGLALGIAEQTVSRHWKALR